MSVTAQEAALQAWVSSTLDTTTIFARQAAPRPALPYATVLVLSERGLGDADVVTTDVVEGEGFASRLILRYQGVCSVQIFGEDAVERLRTLRASLHDHATKSANDLAHLVVSHVLAEHARTFALLDTSFEPRAGADFVYRFCDVAEHEVAEIETITISEVA